ncbi:hypothetical protein R83H12_02237 [Fibrobacteria bacterium R8-3-H12]
MQPATIEKTQTKTRRAKNAKPYRKIIDLGNGVKFPVESEEQARTVEWLVSQAKAGRMSLPTMAPGATIIPKNNDGIKREDWWPIYEESRADRF